MEEGDFEKKETTLTPKEKKLLFTSDTDFKKIALSSLLDEDHTVDSSKSKILNCLLEDVEEIQKPKENLEKVIPKQLSEEEKRQKVLNNLFDDEEIKDEKKTNILKHLLDEDVQENINQLHEEIEIPKEPEENEISKELNEEEKRQKVLNSLFDDEVKDEKKSKVLKHLLDDSDEDIQISEENIKYVEQTKEVIEEKPKENLEKEIPKQLSEEEKKQKILNTLFDDDEVKEEKKSKLLKHLFDSDKDENNIQEPQENIKDTLDLKELNEEEKRQKVINSLIDEEDLDSSKSKILNSLLEDVEDLQKPKENLDKEIPKELSEEEKRQNVLNSLFDDDEVKDEKKSNILKHLLDEDVQENINQLHEEIEIPKEPEENEKSKEINEEPKELNEEEKRQKVLNSLFDEVKDEKKSKVLKHLLNDSDEDINKTEEFIEIQKDEKNDKEYILSTEGSEEDEINEEIKNLEKKYQKEHLTEEERKNQIISSLLDGDFTDSKSKAIELLNNDSESPQKLIRDEDLYKDNNSQTSKKTDFQLEKDSMRKLILDKDIIKKEPNNRKQLEKKKSFDTHKIQTVLSFIDNEIEKEVIKNILSESLNESPQSPKFGKIIDDEEEWLPMDTFVESFKSKPKDPLENTSTTIKNIVMIQSSCRGYLIRYKLEIPKDLESSKSLKLDLNVKSSSIESPREAFSPRTLEERRKEQLKKFRQSQYQKWEKISSEQLEQTKSGSSFEKRNKPILEEEEIINPLYEEDIIIMNLLYEEDIIYENPLYEEDEITMNPLFEEIEEIFSNDKTDEKLFVEQLKSKIQIQDRTKGVNIHKKTFIGSELIDYILSINDRYTRPDAIYLAQSLMNRFVFKSVKLSEREFKDESTSFYRFVEHYYNPAVLNSPPDDFDFEYRPKEDEERVLRKIDILWKLICNQYVKISPKKTIKISYKLLSISQEFQNLKNELYNLQKFDPLLLEEDERKAFFLNIYNILVIHALLLCGKPNSYLSRTLFFKTKYYVIGNYKISLDDIEHTILRGDHSIPHEIFIQCFGGKSIHQLALNLDPRIHFALHQATISSPILRFYESSTINEELDLSVRINLQNNIVLQKNEIHLPNIFEIYREDFGNVKNQLDFIFHYLNDTQKLKFKEIRNSKVFVIKFLPYNSNLNKKDSREEVEDLRIEYREIFMDPNLRKYFKLFSIREFNEENILFYEDIEKYETLDDGYQRYLFAKEIFNTYLINGSEKEINVSQKPVLKIIDILKKEENKIKELNSYKPYLHVNVFEELKFIIKEVMLDIYARFQSSPEYQEMVLLQLENSLKDYAKRDSVDISATMLGASTGIKMKSKLKTKPYFSGLIEYYSDKFKDNLVIVSNAGYEEVVPLSEIKKQSQSRLALFNAIGSEKYLNDDDSILRASYTDKQMDKIINNRDSIAITQKPQSPKPGTFIHGGSLTQSIQSPKENEPRKKRLTMSDQKVFGENVN